MQKKTHLNPVIAKKNYNNNLQTPTKWVLGNKNAKISMVFPKR